MSFLAPLFLAGAAAAAVPIVLHLLKREPEARVRFALVRLLRQGPVEHTRRRHLRDLLLLALRVAALLLLAVAFARPFFAASEASGYAGATVVALDTSLSLSAAGRFDRARTLAKEAINRAPSDHLVAVTTFAREASVVAEPSEDRGRALAAIDAATTGFGATSYRAALASASDLLAGRGGTIVVVTDLQESGWDAGDPAVIPASARVEVADVGLPPPNLAVVAIRVVNNRIAATVRHTDPEGGAAREARVRLAVDGKPAGEGSATIGPGQSAEVILPGARGATASATVEDADGVQGDNVRHLVLDVEGRPAVLVVTATGNLPRDAFYVHHALAAEGAAGAPFRIVSASGEQLSAWTGARLAGHVAVVLLSTRGLERSGRELLAQYVQQGGGLFVAAGPEVDGEVAAGALAGQVAMAEPGKESQPPAGRPRTFAPIDQRHPIFRAFGARVSALGLPTFERIVAIQGTSCRVLARFTTGETAVLECEPGEGRAIVLASDLNRQWNDFPRHATFVPFLHEAVRYLAGNRPQEAEYLVGEAPPGIPATPGVFTLPAAIEGSSRRVAVNVDPVEADAGRLTPDEFQAAVTRMQDAAPSQERLERRQHEERQRLWQYLLGLMLIGMVGESLVAARTA